MPANCISSSHERISNACNSDIGEWPSRCPQRLGSREGAVALLKSVWQPCLCHCFVLGAVFSDGSGSDQCHYFEYKAVALSFELGGWLGRSLLRPGGCFETLAELDDGCRGTGSSRTPTPATRSRRLDQARLRPERKQWSPLEGSSQIQTPKAMSGEVNSNSVFAASLWRFHFLTPVACAPVWDGINAIAAARPGRIVVDTPVASAPCVARIVS